MSGFLYRVQIDKVTQCSVRADKLWPFGRVTPVERQKAGLHGIKPVLGV